MTLIPFFIWFAYGLDQCSCWEPFSGKTLLIGFVILSFSVCGVFSSLPSPSLLSFPPSLSLLLFPSPSPSLFLSLWPFFPCSTFFSGLRQDLTMQPGLVLICLHSPNWPQTLGHPSVSTSWVLESQVCAITSRGIISFKLLYFCAHALTS